MTTLRHLSVAVSDTASDTTKSTSIDIIVIDTAGRIETIILIKNTSIDGHGLLYLINGYAYSGGMADSVVVSQSLDACNTDSIVLVDPYSEIVVSVIDASSIMRPIAWITARDNHGLTQS
jgi:hypothetical protein